MHLPPTEPSVSHAGVPSSKSSDSFLGRRGRDELIHDELVGLCLLLGTRQYNLAILDDQVAHLDGLILVLDLQTFLSDVSVPFFDQSVFGSELLILCFDLRFGIIVLRFHLVEGFGLALKLSLRLFVVGIQLVKLLSEDPNLVAIRIAILGQTLQLPVRWAFVSEVPGEIQEKLWWKLSRFAVIFVDVTEDVFIDTVCVSVKGFPTHWVATWCSAIYGLNSLETRATSFRTVALR